MNPATKTKHAPASATVLVVAASGGVGEAVARLLCAEGYTVIGTCRTAAQARLLISRGVCHRTLCFDLDDSESIERGFRKLDTLHVPHLDALFYCAGVSHAVPLEQESMADMRKMFEVNVFGALRVVQLALPRLLERHGRIVLIGSSSGGLGVPMLGAYSASKFALEGLADALRREMAEHHIGVSLLIPGGIKTAMTEKQMAEVHAAIENLGGEVDVKYGKRYQRHQQLLKLVDMTAQAPEDVAFRALTALKDANPKPRYFCGAGQALLRGAMHLLPDKVWDGLLPGLLDLTNGKAPATGGATRPFLGRTEPLHQLSAFDALMLYGESARTPMHVGPFFIYDASTAPKGKVRLSDILRTFEQRLPLAPILRRKLVRVPFNLDEPYWVDDPGFDLEQHVRHVTLTAPGNRRQLQILLARLAAAPMDFSRPAWDACVIDGLNAVSGVPKGSFGMLLRIHHAAIDGHSGHAVLRVLHDLSSVAPPSDPSAVAAYPPALMPTTGQMLARAYFHLLGKPGKIAGVAAKAVTAVRNAQSLKRGHPGEERSTPVTRFSAKVNSRRVVILLNLNMESLRPVRLAVEGATLNDVIVSIVSGAMRHYLESKGELPGRSMTTGMPINIRTGTDVDKPGNVVTLAALNMHSNIAAPLPRVHAIHASAIFSKAYQDAIGARIVADVAESIPAGLTALGSRVASAAGLMEKLHVINTVVTNVHGPQVPYYLAGAKLVEFHATGIILDGLGLFHSVNSYCGNIAFTVLADHRMLPDPAFYEQCLRDSYEEHIAAAADIVRAKPKTLGNGRHRFAPHAEAAHCQALVPKTATPKRSATQIKIPARRKTVKALLLPRKGGNAGRHEMKAS